MQRQLDQRTTGGPLPQPPPTASAAFEEIYLTTARAGLVQRMRALATERFAPRAAGYDQRGVFPAEDFEDLFAAGLHAPTLPEEFGGLGLGPLHGDLLTLWLLTKEVAKADLSLARCWEGHANSLVILDGLADLQQKERWFAGVVERGEKWVAWSGEPQARALDEKTSFGTTVQKVEGGWMVSGTKAFCTSAGGADWAVLLVNTAGPGGARHAAGSPQTLLLLGCDLHDRSITIDTSWWNPVGMRATVSHHVRFQDTFIPDENVIGRPGQYLLDGWQTCFAPHYAASFLGAAEAAFDYAMAYVRCQKKTDDPYVQHRVGAMSVNVEAAYLWLLHTARLWESGRRDEAQVAGTRARHAVEHLAQDTVENAIRTCGARSLNRPSALERIFRDLAIYVRHDNDDQVLATIGKAALGKEFDPSFYKP